MSKVNSIEGLEKIREKANNLPVRIKRDKWGAVYISEMNALEFIDVLIGWIKQEREIS